MTIKLSKSRFVAGCQCLKRLYLQVHEPGLAAEPKGSADAIIEQGREVGLLARKLFPGGIEVRGERGLDESLRATRELVANREVPAIFEGTFEHGGAKNCLLVEIEELHSPHGPSWRAVTRSAYEFSSDQQVARAILMSRCPMLRKVDVARIAGVCTIEQSTIGCGATLTASVWSFSIN